MQEKGLCPVEHLDFGQKGLTWRPFGEWVRGGGAKSERDLEVEGPRGEGVGERAAGPEKRAGLGPVVCPELCPYPTGICRTWSHSRSSSRSPLPKKGLGSCVLVFSKPTEGLGFTLGSIWIRTKAE